MSSFIQQVLDNLPHIEPEEMEPVLRAIKGLEERGWTVAEAARKLYWLEHVSPLISEERALSRMRAIEEEVAARQAKM